MARLLANLKILRCFAGKGLLFSEGQGPFLFGQLYDGCTSVQGFLTFFHAMLAGG
jgi:hypothetical protein